MMKMMVINYQSKEVAHELLRVSCHYWIIDLKRGQRYFECDCYLYINMITKRMAMKKSTIPAFIC